MSAWRSVWLFKHEQLHGIQTYAADQRMHSGKMCFIEYGYESLNDGDTFWVRRR